MKSFLLLFLLLAGSLTAAPFDAPVLVDSLQQMETPRGWDGRPGPAGELGHWQLTAAVWRQHMPGIPFAKARQPRYARACALKHVRWLAEQIERHGYPPTPACVATAWTIGLTGFLRRHGRTTDFGRRTANLYSVMP